jgi:hypothetical protein
MAMVQKNYSHSFYLNIYGSDGTIRRVDFRRGMNVVDAALFDTPEYKSYAKALELPDEIKVAKPADPQQGLSGGTGALVDEEAIRAANAKRIAEAEDVKGETALEAAARKSKRK